MYCKKCGSRLDTHAKFCGSCGAKLEEKKTAEESKTQMSDLLKRAKSGESEAIEELYQMTYAQGYSVAVQIVKNEQDACDLLQDAYITAFQKLDTLTKPESFRSWFHCIVANKCRDWLKKKKPQLFTDMGSEDESVEFEDTLECDRVEFSPEAQVDYQETKRLMDDILQKLPEDQRLCILMYYYEELGVQDIAQALGCSTGTVKSRLNYGRNKIKTEVEDLKKKGVHLYGIAPIPFLVWMLRGMAKDVSVPRAASVVESAGKTIAGVTGTVAGQAVAETSDTTVANATTGTLGSVASETVKESAKKTTKKVLAAKVAACTIGAVTAVGVGVSTPKIIQHMQRNTAEKAEETLHDTQEDSKEIQMDQLDVFADLNVTFSGISPKVEMTLDYQGTDFSDEDFSVNDSEPLENGQDVRVELTEDGIEKYRELYGEDPIQTSRLYQVSVPLYYASKSADICEVSLEKMKKQAEDTHAGIRSEWESQSEQFQGITYIGNYFLSAKAEADVQNKLYLLYEIKVRNTAENSYDQKYDQVQTYYWYLCYDDVYVDKEGNVQNSIYEGYEVTSDRFEIDSDVRTGRLLHPTYTWNYTGYKTRDELYNATVNRNAEKYTDEKNLIDFGE